MLYERPDVNEYLTLPPGIRTGFSVHCATAGGDTTISLELFLHLREGGTIQLTDHSTAVHANLTDSLFHHALQRGTETILRRDEIYRSGPTLEVVNSEVVHLLHRYLGDARHVLDVGCGCGPYARPLMEKGYHWMGAEVKEGDCVTMQERSLPHVRVIPNQPLPFSDEQFDAAMCIEVLEHIEAPDAFLKEISRVIRGRLLVSVPNAELLPLLSAHHIIPAHMLEPDHKNFFTRFSLSALLRRHFAFAEVIDYAPLPIGDLIGEVLPYHLFAVAGKSSIARS